MPEGYPLHVQHPRENGKYKASAFNDKPKPDREFVVASSNKYSSLPPSLPSAPFKLDFTMFIMSTCDSVETVSSSPELKEYLTLRKIIKQLESELISAQIYVDAEVNTYYSNIKEKNDIRGMLPAELDPSSNYATASGSSSSYAMESRSPSQGGLQRSEAFRHLKDLENRYLVAYMRYLFLSISILHTFSSLHSSPYFDTLSLPSPPITPPRTPGGSNSTNLSAYSPPPPYWGNHHGETNNVRGSSRIVRPHM